MSTRYPRPRDQRGPAAPAAPAAGPTARDAALLIDFDNVTIGSRKDLQAELKALLGSDVIRGRLLLRRAYADWSRYPNSVVPLTGNSIDLIYAPAHGPSKKNATDIRLAIDAMELVFTRSEIGTYILLSGDSDFSALVIKLKEYGKYVIGVGVRESASDLLAQNCDEYYSYTALAGLARGADEPDAPRDPWELVVDAVDRMARNGDTMRADRLKQVMVDMDPTFDERNLGMPKFSRFVSEAANRGLLTLTRLESGQYEIAPARRDTARDLPRDAGRDRGREERGRDDRTRDARDERRPSPRDVARDFARGLAGDPTRDAALTFDPTEAELAERGFEADEDEDSGAAEPAGRADRSDRGRGRRRGRGRSGRDFGRTDEFAVPTFEDQPAPEPRAPETRDLVPIPVAPTIGVQGERLTRAEAFDLVRRGVDALAQGDDSRVAVQPLREQVFALLGRDSESLSERMFPRIVQDAADNGVVRVARDGDTLVAMRVPRPAAPAVSDEPSRAAAVQPAAPPPPIATAPAAPRGMGPRGLNRGRTGRGAPPPELLLIGAVATDGTPAAAPSVDAPQDGGTQEATAARQPELAEPEFGQPGSGQPQAADAPAAGAQSVASPAVDTIPVDAVPVDAAGDNAAGSTAAESTPADTAALGADTASGADVLDATADADQAEVDGAEADDAAGDTAADASATPAGGRGRRRGGRGRGRGGRNNAPAPEAAVAPELTSVEPPAPTPAADDTAAPARGRGARKVAAKAAAKAPTKTAAKRAARKRAGAPAGDADA